jgi:uncharacterized YigZ family protein
MTDIFRTISSPSSGQITEKRSKFLAFAFPVSTVEEVKALVEEYQKKYYDARHACYAYMLGHERLVFRANDNGEPSGTAGKPILGQINSNELTNILIIVVRYFGGIKLGAGGLIRAYSGSVTDALAEAKKLDKVPVDVWQITYPYDLSGKLEGWLRRNTENAEFDYSDQVTCIFETRENNIADTIRDLTRGSAEAELVEHTFREVEVA